MSLNFDIHIGKDGRAIMKKDGMNSIVKNLDKTVRAIMNPEDELEHEMNTYAHDPEQYYNKTKGKYNYNMKETEEDAEVVGIVEDVKSLILDMSQELLIAAKKKIASKIADVESVIAKSKQPDNIVRFQSYLAGLRKALELLG